MFDARCQNLIIANLVLQNPPHAFDVIAGMAPVAFGIDVTKIKLVLQALADGGNGTGNFTGHKSFAADRAFVIEQNAV